MSQSLPPDYPKLPYKEIKVHLDEGVLTIVFNRSKQRNTFVGALAEEMLDIFALADLDDRVRAVVLTAEANAPAYCSGAEIGANGFDVLWNPEWEKEGWQAHRDQGGMISLAIYNCRKLTIAAINGHAAGVGATAMQLPFDFRFIWSGAKVTFPFVARGISAEATSSYMLPRLIGASRATSILLTGATLPATSHLFSGLYHETLPTREEVYPAALAFAKKLAVTTSPASVAWTKALIQHPGDSAEENHLLDSPAIRILGKGKDAQEGVQAFFEKRNPKFDNSLKILDGHVPWWRSPDTKHRKSKL